MPLAQINGIELCYEEHGSGEALLLINGLGGTSLDWEPLLPAFTGQFRVIAPDNRGCGRSDAPPGPYTMRQMADDAAGLLTYLGVRRAHVLGASMGGMIAQELVLNHASLVDRLVLFGTCACPRSEIAGPLLTFFEQMAERLDPASATLGWLPWLYTPAFVADANNVEAVLAWQNPYPQTLHGFVAQVDAVRSHDTLDRLGGIDTPTLVLVGAEDILTPVYYARELADRIPRAELRVLERGGHSALWEDQAGSCEAILSFLSA